MVNTTVLMFGARVVIEKVRKRNEQTNSYYIARMDGD